jgi:hypothetical protein
VLEVKSFRDRVGEADRRRDEKARRRREKAADAYEAGPMRRTKPGEVMMTKVLTMAMVEVMMSRGWDYVGTAQGASAGSSIPHYALQKVHPES